MVKHPRKRLFVDRKVQGALVMQVVRYWLLALLTVGGLMFLGWVCMGSGLQGVVTSSDSLKDVMPLISIGVVASAMVMLVLVADLIRVSNRFAGPLVRLNKHMEEAFATGELKPVSFRDNDYWQELADNYNNLIKRFEASNNECLKQPSGSQVADEELSDEVSEEPELAAV